MLKLMGKKIFTILHSKCLLSWTSERDNNLLLMFRMRVKIAVNQIALRVNRVYSPVVVSVTAVGLAA